MSKVGDKYVIEIGEVYETTAELVSEVGEKTCDTPDNLYRIKGFNSLVFDEDGLNKLEKYEEVANQAGIDVLCEQKYKQGLNDAWEAARKLRITKENYPDMVELRELFHIAPPKNDVDILKDFSASEVVSKIKAYEEQKKAEEEEIKVGDEVVDTRDDEEFIVVHVHEGYKGFYDAIRKDGTTYSFTDPDARIYKKTGRTFPQIAEVLKQLQEGEE